MAIVGIGCRHRLSAQVVGIGQTPRLVHKEQLHYINAVIHESMRMACLLLQPNHYTNADVSIKDYLIPRGTVVIPCLMSVLLDEEYFPNPHTFKPDRFLNEDGTFRKDEHCIPFGVGKRLCLGQSLAEKEMFLFFTGLMQKFDINPDPNQPLPSYAIRDGIGRGTLRSAPSFNILLTYRSGWLSC